MKIVLASENSVLIYLGANISPELLTTIANTAQQLKSKLGEFIIDITPCYTSLLVSYDLNLIGHQSFSDKVENCLQNIGNTAQQTTPKFIHIPVYYDLETGLDLDRILSEKNLDLLSFIEIHSANQYLVYAIGFSPVFAFLGEVDARIQLARLSTPRISIPAGSVGIADSQTGIYPAQSSGGWNIVGRTPIDLSLKNPANIDKFKIGDLVKFIPISRDEYIAQGGLL